MVQMVFSLIAVVAIILGLAWMTRRMQVLRGAGGSELSVRASLSVGLKERVVIVEAQGRQFLIGVAPGQVSMLKALGAVPQEPAVAPPPAGNPSVGEAFAIQLNKLLGR